MKILADIGGTHVRFGLSMDGLLKGVRKYQVLDFDSLGDAVQTYCHESDLEPRGSLSIATAGYEEAGIWKFVNNNKWQIDPKTLEEGGWTIPVILNDFEAAAWSLLSLEGDEKKIWRRAEGASSSLCLLGPGTGLGLAYLHRDGEQCRVHKTHGGHIPVASVTDEQWLVVQTINRLNRGRVTPVFENFVSGPGLYNIYAAQCLMSGKLRRYNHTEQLVENRHEAEVRDSLRLFHEFLGLFASSAVVTGHAYGGLYLTGGVLDRLSEYGLFNLDHFLKFFDLELASSVKRDLAATPIIRIATPYPALRGLMVLESQNRA